MKGWPPAFGTLFQNSEVHMVKDNWTVFILYPGESSSQCTILCSWSSVLRKWDICQGQEVWPMVPSTIYSTRQWTLCPHVKCRRGPDIQTTIDQLISWIIWFSSSNSSSSNLRLFSVFPTIKLDDENHRTAQSIKLDKHYAKAWCIEGKPEYSILHGPKWRKALDNSFLQTQTICAQRNF